MFVNGVGIGNVVLFFVMEGYCRFVFKGKGFFMF